MRLPVKRRRGRRGTVSIEIVLVLPLFLVMLMGAVQFSMLLNARQQLLAASREGARVAAQGGTFEEVAETVRRVVGTTGRLASAEVRVCRVTEGVAGVDNNRQRVEVTVAAPAAIVAPNWLGWVGINFAGRNLIAATVMNVE
jgi:Flp pilus assembly protein TadG